MSNKNMHKVYIAGPITNDPDYMEKFMAAEVYLKDKGYDVFNPARNQGYSYKEFIDMGLFELSHCDTIYLLKGWKESIGAQIEFRYAAAVGMTLIFEGQI